MAALVFSDRVSLERIVMCYRPSLLFASTVAPTIEKSIGTRHEESRRSASEFVLGLTSAVAVL